MWIRWCVAICLLGVGCSDPDIIQPRSLILQEDQAVHMKCEQRKGHNAMYWYRQKVGQALELLFAFQNNVQTAKGNSLERFEAQQFETKYCKLDISHVKPDDSSVYFCASSQDTALQSHHAFLQKPPPQLIGLSDPDIIQPRSRILQEGQAAHMKCEQRKGHNAMYWYQQKSGQALELLFAFQLNSLVHKGSNVERFEAQQFETKFCKLNISNVKPEDSSVYFCASSQDTALQSYHLFLQKPPPQ